MVKCLHEFEFFTVFLKNRTLIYKIKSSKVTDYATLKTPNFVFHFPELKLSYKTSLHWKCGFVYLAVFSTFY